MGKKETAKEFRLNGVGSTLVYILAGNEKIG